MLSGMRQHKTWKLRSATTKSISGFAFGTMEKGLAPRFFAETDVRGTTACME